jgi:hypothetical protein
MQPTALAPLAPLVRCVCVRARRTLLCHALLFAQGFLCPHTRVSPQFSEAKRVDMMAKLDANQASRVESRLKRQEGVSADKDPLQNAEAFWRQFNPHLEGVLRTLECVCDYGDGL